MTRFAFVVFRSPALPAGSSPWIKHLKPESQFLASMLFLVAIMALLICSNETNITTFHEPSLRNEGTNLCKGGRKKTDK